MIYWAEAGELALSHDGRVYHYDPESEGPPRPLGPVESAEAPAGSARDLAGLRAAWDDARGRGDDRDDWSAWWRSTRGC